MNFPALRFKHDDGRDFPDWEERKIGNFVLSHKGGAPLKPADFVKNGNFEVIPKKAISRGGYLELDEVEPTYCSKEFFEANQGSVVDSSFLITTLRDLVPSGPSIGYIVKYISNKKYILAQGVYGIKVDENLIEDFLIQYSNTSKYRELMQTMMVGSTQVHIRNSDFFNTPFAVPILKEQTKIANFLTTIDKKITQLTQKNDLLTQYKKGVMQKIFSQELRFKDDDGGDFPDWEERKLADLVEKIGSGGTPKSTNTEYYDGNIPWVSIADMTSSGKFILDTKRKITTLGLKESSARLYPVGVVLFAMYASIGEVAIAKVPVTTSQAILGIQPKNELMLSEYLYFWLLSLKDKIVLMGQQGTQSNLNLDIVKNFIISVPSISEQTKITDFFTSIDDKIIATQSQLQAVKQYKQGLLQQMFV
jgi:type I restriction enzyme S subunit